MLRTDALIRGRRIDTDAVITVNAGLKARARRYIAAGGKDRATDSVGTKSAANTSMTTADTHRLLARLETSPSAGC
jgi:hypothetical protein